MHEERCPVCGATCWAWLKKSKITLEIVGCDICIDSLDEIDAYEAGIYGQ